MIRLLIADDEKLEREALADMVSRRFEHEVVLELAENGRKAADTAVLWGADLILMDIEMPGMSGLDAARAVLAQRPACRVIFVTAYSLFRYAHEAVHLGACDYLLKPVDPDELEASIRRAMRQIEAERKLEGLARTTELSPEPETPEIPENPEEGAPEAESPEGENSQTAMVMTQVRRYLEDNYMFDLAGQRGRNFAHQSGVPLGPIQKIPKDELLGLPDGAADQRGQGAAGRSVPFLGGGGLHGRLRGRQLFCPGL